jgi:hypothetical protein
MSIKTARTNVKKSLKVVLLNSLFTSLVVTVVIILISYLVCANPVILAPLFLGEYQIALIQAAYYIGGIFLFDLITNYLNIWTSIKLLWKTRNID